MAKAIVLVLLLLSSAAHANAIYSFTGTCLTTCTGTATISMVFKNPTISDENFVSFIYTDNVGINDFQNPYHFFPLQLPEFIYRDGFSATCCFAWEFKTHADGTWYAFWELGTGPTGQPTFHEATGNNGVWSLNGVATVPEPPVWALMLLPWAIFLTYAKVAREQ